MANQMKELELQLKREIFEGSYFEYFKWAFALLLPNEKFEDTFHIKYLCDLYQVEVERIIARVEKTKDIIVNIPPRASKSYITSVMLTGWAWIKDPTLTMISVSFDEDLTLLNAQLSKDIIKSDEYQELFGDRYAIRGDMDSKSFYQNDKGGFRMSKTTGANITGHKGVIIIVDDPINPKKAESPAYRKDIIEYYTRSLYNRLTPPNLGIRIIIMQRLHEEDLSGYLLAKNPEDYLHICLPAETAGNEVKPAELRVKYQSGLLDPIRLNAKILAGFRKILGSRGYSGQYDQRPSPDEGGIIKKEWLEIVAPENLVRDSINEGIHFFVDSAYTEDTENDPTAILTCYCSHNILYILDATEAWLEFPRLIAYIKQHVQRYQLSASSKIFIEPKASGKSIAQQLRATTMLNVVEVKAPDVDKITRAHAVTPQLESQRVKLVRGAYAAHFIEHCSVFPNGVHDDMLDTLVMAINELLLTNGPDVMWL